MAKKNRREIDRREFLKVLGVGTATTTAALYGCSLKDGSVTEAGGSGNIGVWLYALADGGQRRPR